MNIGLDLDSTLINWVTSPQEWAAMSLGIHGYPKHPTDYDWGNYMKEHRDLIIRLLSDPNFMGKENSRYDPLDRLALARWYDAGHRLVVITSRHKKVEKVTQTLVHEFFPEIYVVVRCDGIEQKRAPMVEWSLDVWIDDNPRGIEIATNLGIRAYGIVNSTTRHYNEGQMNILAKHPNVRLVEHIRDIKL